MNATICISKQKIQLSLLQYDDKSFSNFWSGSPMIKIGILKVKVRNSSPHTYNLG